MKHLAAATLLIGLTCLTTNAEAGVRGSSYLVISVDLPDAIAARFFPDGRCEVEGPDTVFPGTFGELDLLVVSFFEAAMPLGALGELRLSGIAFFGQFAFGTLETRDPGGEVTGSVRVLLLREGPVE